MVFGASLQQHEGEVLAGDISAAAEGAADLDAAAAGGVGQVAASGRWPGLTIVQSRPLWVSASSASRLAYRYGRIASAAPATSWVPIAAAVAVAGEQPKQTQANLAIAADHHYLHGR